MAKQFMRRVCLALVVCMLMTMLPAPVLAQDVEVITSTLEQAPEVEEAASALEPEPIAADEPGQEPADDAEQKPADEPESEPARIVSFDLAGLPGGIAVPYGTEEEDLNLPEELTALLEGGASATVAVSWTCVEGAPYDPQPANPAEARYAFQARLAGDYACDAALLPRMGVVFEDVPTVLAEASDADLASEYGLEACGEGAACEMVGSIFRLTAGEFKVVDADKAKGKLININSGATLNVEEDLAANIFVIGGTLNITGSSADPVKVDYVDVMSGTATIAYGDLGSLRVAGGNATLSNTTVSSTGTRVENGGSLTASSTIFYVLQCSSATCKVTDGSKIVSLDIYGSLYANTVEISDSSVRGIFLGGEVLAELVERNWPTNVDLVPGAQAKTITVDNPFDGIENISLPDTGYRLEYVPTMDVVPDVGETIAYSAKLYNGNSAIGNHVTFERTVKTTLYLAGGTITKTYDGDGEFSYAWVRDPKWVDANDNNVESRTGVAVNAVIDGTDAGEYAKANVKSIEIVQTTSAPDDMAFVADVEHLDKEKFIAVIKPAEVNLKGSIYRNKDEAITWSDALKQTSLNVSEQGTEWSMEKRKELEGEVKLKREGYDDLLKDNLTYDNLEDYRKRVTNIEQDGIQNYNLVVDAATTYSPDGLYVKYRVKTEESLNVSGTFYAGPWAAEPVITATGFAAGNEDRPVMYKYRKSGTTEWLSTMPAEMDDQAKYDILAILEPYNAYQAEEITFENALTGERLKWSLELKLDRKSVSHGNEVKFTATITPPANGHTDGYKDAEVKFYSDGNEIPDITARYDETQRAFVAVAPCKLAVGDHEIYAELQTPEGCDKIQSGVAALNVTMRSIAVSYVTGGLISAKSLYANDGTTRLVTWSPALTEEWVRGQSEGCMHFVGKDNIGRYVCIDDDIGAEDYTLTWVNTGTGETLDGVPTDAGEYNMIIALVGDAADRYALELTNTVVNTSDTLKYTIPMLDFEDFWVQYYMRITDLNPGVYDPENPDAPVRPASFTVCSPDEGYTLVEGEHYQVVFGEENHTEVGKAWLYIEGIGNARGRMKIEYEIVPKPEPTPEPTAVPPTRPVVTDAPTPEPTEEPTAEPTEEPTLAPTEQPTATATDLPTATAPATAKPSSAAKPTATEKPTDAAEPTATAEPTDAAVPVAPLDNVLYDEYLGTGEDLGQLSIVFDEEGNPQDYELLPIVTEKELLVCARPNKEGRVVCRSLILSALQIKRLHLDCELETLLFRNGDMTESADLAELYTGRMAQLIALGFEQDLAQLELDALLWEELPEAELTDAQLAKAKLELCILPVTLEDGREGTSVQVILHVDGEQLDVSALTESLGVNLSVDELLTEDNLDTFAQLYSIVLVAQTEAAEQAQPAAPEELTLTDELRTLPEELPEEQLKEHTDTAEQFDVTIVDEPNPVVLYSENTELRSYRTNVLAAPYAGAGAYMLKENEPAPGQD